MVKSKLKNDNKSDFDVVVIGGGPAGMTAAIEATSLGKKVLLLEKNPGLGKKLLISGGGRCNVTNNKPVVREMLSQYKEAGKFLFSTFIQYGVTDTINFFSKRDLEFKEENEGRLFPVTNKAESVYQVLVDELKKLNVTITCNARVLDVTKKSDLFLITLANDTGITAKNIVIATGGQSRPETGSTGDALPWLKNFGHTIHQVSNALVPVAITDSWVKELSGVTLSDVKISLYLEDTKKMASVGRLLFTHFGVSGPLILNMSKKIGGYLEEGDVTLKIDLLPTISGDDLQKHILQLFQQQSNKKLKNLLPEIIPSALVTAILEIAAVDGEMFVNSVSAGDRKKIAVLIKLLPMRVERLLGSDKAVVSSGGVDLREVDFKTMESTLVPGLYLIGDVLDINRPSGGYSLQLCWSTGAVAGRNI